MAMESMPMSMRSDDAADKAVKALLKWKGCNSESEKPQLLNSDDDFVYLFVSLNKIPPKGRTNAYKIPLIHPLFSPDTDASELCLFVDDRPGRLPTSKDAKSKLKSDGVPVSKVIKLSKLKSDYKPFEAKRQLCDSYHLFLADRRIIPLLPKHLGKHFYKKKKIPVPVDLEHRNWKEQVHRLCKSALLHLNTGTCTALRVARASMSPAHIVQNVVAAINGVADTVPNKWKNVRSLHLKFSNSVALPLYQSAPPQPNLKIIGLADALVVATAEDNKKKRGREEKQGDESSKVSSSSKKGRIHQVRYMDDAIDKLVSDEEVKNDELDIDDNVEELVPPPKKKSPKTNNKAQHLKVKGKKEKVEADGAKINKANKVRKVSTVAKSVTAKKPKRS